MAARHQREARHAVVGAVADVGVEATEIGGRHAWSCPPTRSPGGRWSTPRPRARRAARPFVGGGRRGGSRGAPGGRARAKDPRARCPSDARAAGAPTRRPAPGPRRRARAPGVSPRARPRSARSGARARSAPARACRHGQAEGRGLESGDAAPARHLPGRRGQVRLRALGPLEQGVGVPGEHHAGSVRRTPRPARTSSSTPASRWSTASCWDTAEGVNWSASATAAIVPRACSSCSRRRRCRSSIDKQLYCSASEMQLF